MPITPSSDDDDVALVDCVWCGDAIDADEAEVVNDGYVCEDCHDAHAFACNDCGEVNHVDDSYMVTHREYQVCEACRENEYFYCEGCDMYLTNSDYSGDNYCYDCDTDGRCDCGDPDCYSDGNGGLPDGIMQWGDAPDLRFFSMQGKLPSMSYTEQKGEWYMGMEIEVAGQVNHTIGDAMVDDTLLSSHMWASTDATIGESGAEIITHPHTYDAWVHDFPWATWTDRIHEDVPDQSRESCTGIHIHVSRTAFYSAKGKPRASHLYKFMQFIQVNEEAVMYLAGRESTNYCDWSQDRDAVSRVQDAKQGSSTSSSVRYRPINTQNRATVELRFFDGRTDPDFMKRAIQFTHSLVEFTRIGGAKSPRKWEDYTKYVRHNAMRYPQLVAYLNVESRRLLKGALVSEYRYKDDVMPKVRLKVKEEKDRQAEREAARLIRIAERETRIANPPTCDCEHCNEAIANETIPSPSEHVTIDPPAPWERELYVRDNIIERNQLIIASGLRYRQVYSHFMTARVDADDYGTRNMYTANPDLYHASEWIDERISQFICIPATN